MMQASTPSWVDLIIDYLRQHEDEINRLTHGRVSFDLYGEQMRPRIERSEIPVRRSAPNN